MLESVGDLLRSVIQSGLRKVVPLCGALALSAGSFPANAADDIPVPSSQAIRLVGNEARSLDGRQTIAPVTIRDDLGQADFAVGLSFETESTGTHDLGDLVSLWDARTRHGFTLGLRNNTGVTTSQPNWRQLQFGIDAGTEPEWKNEGRPGSAILGFSIAVHGGQLYVGTCEVGDDSVGKVYRYLGPGRWQALKPLDGSNSVTALAAFNGSLYAGTGKYRLAGSSLAESQNPAFGGKVFRLTDDDDWELVGDLAPTEAIAGFVTYGGKLYASSLYKPAGFFRYDGGTDWTPILTPDSRRVESMVVHDGALYAGSYDSGAVYRFDGTSWTDLGLVAADITQTYSFVTYQNALHVSTWPAGKVYRLDDGNRWTDCGRLGNEQEVMAMLIHNGSFYAGTLPGGQVYRYAGATDWTLLKQIDQTPDVRFRRVWTMATFQGRLFSTTLPSGNVWSMSAGHLVTDDRELGPGWHDVVAQRKSGRLRIFVDGRKVAESDAPPLGLKTGGLELKLGDGPRGQFRGQVRNAWFDPGKP
ncbi:hypothetical protein Pan44_50600 [Caulifigura coniformis]|uniref:LamG-like jellyroll fold domain-containing protein n=1 Tax=Caulifigura coniformis TaxID=2527983 RepID=A0A517SLJ9_9PLAN|nr:hypothetical protein [Caulifigura coniformis]QDT56996.1 hypothetical protein Pan44_50600 [Caulifigura coniformis]